MLRIWGARKRYCDRVTRRDFLQIGAFGSALSLSALLRLRAQAAKPSSNKSVIMIFLPGGPPHIDMYDMKPEAPVEIRGEFKPVATNVNGVRICELMPLQAKIWDKLTVLRSVVGGNEHSDMEVMTGYSKAQNRFTHHPSFGSVVSKIRGISSIPPFVSLNGALEGTEPGYLGVAHRPFTLNGPGIEDLRMVRAVHARRLDQRKTLLEGFDTVRREIDASGTMSGLDTFAVRAFDMVASGAVRAALDLNQEPDKVRERYRDVEQVLTARRLIEAGVGCVTLTLGGWDSHDQNFVSLRRNLPLLDRGLANLVQDLHDRGMDKDVVTIAWGEFGRMPKITGNAGRDHWPPVMSTLLAGGGLKMGQAIGSTNARAEYPQDKACTIQQVMATLYRVLGIDPATAFQNGAGRPVPLLEDRNVIPDLV